jgi:ABC-type multidrug transport system fused ATPase/permease subunit
MAHVGLSIGPAVFTDIGACNETILLVSSLINLFSLIFLSFTMSNNTNTQSPTAVIKSIVNYYVLLGFSSLSLSWIAWVCWIMAAERQVRRIRYALFRNILRQEIGWFDVHNAGELSNRLINDLGK